MAQNQSNRPSRHAGSVRNAGSKATLRLRAPDDPERKFVELAQRGRMILDVAASDLEAAEDSLGTYHATTWHFRTALDEAKRSWDRLMAESGAKVVEAALLEPPIASLEIGATEPAGACVVLVPISGGTYRVERIEGTRIAPIQFRLTRLPTGRDEPYFVSKLEDGTHQCDCADWVYRNDGTAPATCKHIQALMGLDWI